MNLHLGKIGRRLSMEYGALSSFENKKILVTGHTGFKGYWLSRFLVLLGAEVFGLALAPSKGTLYSREPSLGLAENTFVDIRDHKRIEKYLINRKFDGVFHLAAQPLVLVSYIAPRDTFETNLMGTINLLGAILKSVNNPWLVVVTTDKVYKNVEKWQGYREDDSLGGKDPYSASKAATEMAINAWQNITKVQNREIQIVAARAGNVIGGGDVSSHRLLPDLMKSFREGKIAAIRNPEAIRPWQHVLDPISGYVRIAEKIMAGETLNSSYNFGPDEASKLRVKEVAQIAVELWPTKVEFRTAEMQNAIPESGLLWLDSSRARNELDWKCRLSVRDAIKWTIEWEIRSRESGILPMVDEQIRKFVKL
jgi:CDP-glucose 4,6-dehydratase